MSNDPNLPITLLDRQLIRRFPIRPNYVTSVLLNLTRIYFSRPELLVTTRFRRRPNVSASPIPENTVIIESPAAWPFEYADKRPAIFIRRLEWICRRLGIGGGRWGGSQDIVEQKLVSWFWRGFHAFYAVSKEGGETEFLIEELINLLLRYGILIRMIFPFQKFQIVNVTRLQSYISATDMFMASVIVRYEWAETWKFEPEYDILEQMITASIPEEEINV
jgi:hypothetical protein